MTTMELKAFRKEVARGVSQLKDERLLKKIQRMVEKETEPAGRVPGLIYDYDEMMRLVEEDMEKYDRGELECISHEALKEEMKTWR